MFLQKQIKHIRDIKINDTVEEVLAKFPNESNENSKKQDYDLDEDKYVVLLYGEYLHRQNFGIKVFDKATNELSAICYADEGTYLEFTIVDDKVVNISYWSATD